MPAVEQIANVAALPGIVGRSLGMPDLHSGYGFSIGNVAAFDMVRVGTVCAFFPPHLSRAGGPPGHCVTGRRRI